MARVVIGDLALLECGSCDGVWLDAAEFERICADREAQGAVLHRWHSHSPRPPIARVQYRPCIGCGKMMNRINFGRISGTVVDVCRGHGTFLDRGELQQIVRFVDGGGLDRARAAERDELREEERRLRSLTPRYAGTPPAGPESGWTLRSLRDFLTALFGPEARR
jgi:Zn-finger nucleic acid-binding protein